MGKLKMEKLPETKDVEYYKGRVFIWKCIAFIWFVLAMCEVFIK